MDKPPKDRNTKDRSEMICPRCSTEGLEPHPGYVDEYEGRSEILKSTRCTNEECLNNDRRIPEEKIRIQMPEKTISDYLPSDISSRDLIVGGVAMLFLVFMAYSYGIGPFGSGGTSGPNGPDRSIVISGNTTELNGEYPNILLYSDDGERIKSTQSSNGSYSIETQIGNGDYKLYPNYPSRPSQKGKNIRVNSRRQSIEVDFEEPGDVINVSLNQTVGRSQFVLNYSNPTNTRDIELKLSPISSDNENNLVTREKRLTSRRSQNVILPVPPSGQKYSVNAPVTTEKFIDKREYYGQTDSYAIYGNKDAKEVRIRLENGSTTDEIGQSFTVPSGGTTETINISSESTVGPVQVTLRNGTSTERQKITGVLRDESEIQVETGTKESVDAILQIEPNSTVTSQNRIEGEINSNLVSHDFEGNMPIRDAFIKFQGGDIKSSSEASTEISVNGQDASTSTDKKELFTASKDSTYRLEWNTNTQRKPELVSYSYFVDGQETEITSENGERILNLNEGQTVSVLAEAGLDTLYEGENPSTESLPNSLEVKQVSFESGGSDGIQPDEEITPEIEVENTADKIVSSPILVYQNGELEGQRRVTFNPGETKVVSSSALGTFRSSSESGLSVWHISDRGPFFIEVGIEDRSYGIGQIDAEILDIGTDGEIALDTNQDGEYDCTVEADSGSCTLPEFTPDGTNSFEVEQNGVSGTDYIIEYTSQTNPRGISLDVRSNGIEDLNYEGVLSQTEAKSGIDIPAKSVNITANVENNIPVEYALILTSESVVNNPVVTVDGRQVISNTGTFVEERQFSIPKLTQGQHELKFKSQEGGYIADVRWTPQEEQSYPFVDINGRRACLPEEFAGDLTCVVSDLGVTPGEHTIEFSNSPETPFSYLIEQEARAVSTEVEILLEGEQSAKFQPTTPQLEPWNASDNINDFFRGNNKVSLSIPEENRIKPDVNAKFEYSIEARVAEGVSAQLISPDGSSESIDIPSDSIRDNRLVNQTSITIPSEMLKSGENTIRFTPRRGIFEVSGSLRIHEDDTLNFSVINI